MVKALYYGDNLEILRTEIRSESVDLIYLDPPFNSQATYNLLFKSPTGQGADAQIEAFEDTWHWGDEAELAFDEVTQSGNTKAADLLNAMRSFLGENDMMAYLAMMAVRLSQLHRVLKETGSLYLHCDPTASHYLKLLLDSIFGPMCFRNEIAWQRTSSHNDPKRYGRIHDILLYYSKGETYTWNQLFEAPDKDFFDAHDFERDADERLYRKRDLTAPAHGGNSGQYEWKGKRPPKGRMWSYTLENMQQLEAESRIVYTRTGMARLKIYVDDLRGLPLQDVWAKPDLWLNAAARERLGYPTQKPLALLERVVSVSSNPGDTVLDPFCGCGTAVHAAEKLGRQWIGIDVTCLAIGLIERRLKAAFPGIVFDVHGTPKTLQDALDLAARDKYQFQWWAVTLIDAQPYGGKKKGADRGIDGIAYFKPDGKRTERAIVSVKGGENVGVGMVRDLHSVMEREKAPLGVLITLAMPTRPMEKEAAAVGIFECDFGKFPRLQIITLAELFQGKRPRIPAPDPGAAFKAAAREDRTSQGRLEI